MQDLSRKKPAEFIWSGLHPVCQAELVVRCSLGPSHDVSVKPFYLAEPIIPQLQAEAVDPEEKLIYLVRPHSTGGDKAMHPIPKCGLWNISYLSHVGAKQTVGRAEFEASNLLLILECFF